MQATIEGHTEGSDFDILLTYIRRGFSPTHCWVHPMPGLLVGVTAARRVDHAGAVAVRFRCLWCSPTIHIRKTGARPDRVARTERI